MKAYIGRVLLSKEDLAKYPFLPESQKYIESLGFTLEDLSSQPGLKVLERAYARIRAAIDRRVDRRLSEDLDIEILSFPTSIVLLRVLSDKILTRRFGVAEGKRVSSFLLEESEEKLAYIAIKGFSWRIRVFKGSIGSRAFSFLIRMEDYIPLVPEYSGLWKLINRPLMKGWVPVTKTELARLSEEAVKKYLEDRCSAEPPMEVPRVIAKIVDKIKESWSAKMEELGLPRSVKVERAEDAYPPCIKALLEDLRNGKNLPHTARFALASFLLHIGKTPDEVIDLFRTVPDFREDIARYQIEHIAGLRGSRVKYLPFKCDNMRSLGLCRWKCKGVKHPLQFYRLALKRGKVEYEEI